MRIRYSSFFNEILNSLYIRRYCVKNYNIVRKLLCKITLLFFLIFISQDLFLSAVTLFFCSVLIRSNLLSACFLSFENRLVKELAEPFLTGIFKALRYKQIKQPYKYWLYIYINICIHIYICISKPYRYDIYM